MLLPRYFKVLPQRNFVSMREKYAEIDFIKIKLCRLKDGN